MSRSTVVARPGLTSLLLAALAFGAWSILDRSGVIRGDSVDPRRPAGHESPAATGSLQPPVKAVEPRAVARFEGRPAPGMPIVLRSDGSAGTDLRLRWVQVEGPPARLEDPTRPDVTLTVPDGATSLGFLLVASNATGSDAARLVIPVEARMAGSASTRLRADAGDDQVGLVGRQTTLNGARSEPRGGIGYRWVQVAGPTVRAELDEGSIHAFVPPSPGVYRFALVVAAGGVISEPDVVTVSVGSAATSLPPVATPGGPESLAALVRAALASLPEGSEKAGGLAEAFEMVAVRVDLYRSYGDLYGELSRRLDRVVPAEPAVRASWIDGLFTPLTARLFEDVRAEGLDLRRAEAWSTGLGAAQKARLAELYRAMADGCRPSPGP